MIQQKVYSYIRFSSPEQETGDSYRRQLEQAEQWADTNGLPLDDTLRMTDRGLSGYHGTHRKRGALGAFLTQIKEGKIAEGSVMLIENMDRLSREVPMTALRQFDEIIRAGIRVVTLQSGMEYTEESINKNPGELYIVVGEIQRANAESERKSYMLKNAWNNKRKLGAAEGKIITRKCPAWLKVTEDGREFEVIPERAEAVKRVFELRAEGKGYYAIEQAMNRMDVWAPTGRDKRTGWRKSYITKLLVNNPSVIGEFQPYHMIEKDKKGKKKEKEYKRVPVGDPIPDYYPPIISRELYDKVQQLRIKNKNAPGRGGGRNGSVRNLFGHIAKCSECGGSMRFINKGQGSNTYLICDRAMRGLDCTASGKILYDRFEEEFLRHCWSLRVDDLLPTTKRQQSEVNDVKLNLEQLTAQLTEINDKLSNLTDSIESTRNKELRQQLEERASERLKAKQAIKDRQKDAHAKLKKMQTVNQSTEQQLQDVQQLINMLHELEGEALKGIRLNLRNKLRNMIERINCRADKSQFMVLFQSGQTQALRLKEDGRVITMTRTKPAQG